ncbi:hypothetical protein ACFLUR_01890 [Chloroflexota bacterium]
MNRDEILEYLTNQVDLLQRKAVELSEHHDEIEKELKGYKQLIRMYRGVYESEAGVGLQNRMPSQIMKILEEKLAEEETSTKKSVKKKAKRHRKAK